jgi:hypothetical protein
LAFALIHDSIVGPPTTYGGENPGPAAGGGDVGGGGPVGALAALAGMGGGGGAAGATDDAKTAGADAVTGNNVGAVTGSTGRTIGG